MKHLLLSILFLAVVGTSIAQTTTGQISYTMDFSSDNPEMAMALPMMQGSTMELYFMPNKSKIDMTMGTFMKMNTTSDTKANKGLMLMEVMGNKTATEMDLSKADKDAKPEDTKVEVTAETKEIIGYKCTKTIIRDAEGNEVIMWVAADLKASLKGQQQFGGSQINGVPLEFSTVNNGMTIHFIATKFNKKVDKKAFNLTIPDGYTKVSEEDLKNMGGGM